ncbi:amidohydrolase [Pseudidiomarina salinarum]|uniref:Amidohydrolase n=1 Tax=Pseudidiomarina salinarum TaxID=435908 RepID=A0A094IWE0_9GAMM|nr:amidohydrolase family protein [Pseudidiomarina salinarum]KFZ30154.1 amidohydrolase [Pseudidiomarina salinarum]RUO68657.1 amidohydrolase [Pseudidiomarina salinarum]
MKKLTVLALSVGVALAAPTFAQDKSEWDVSAPQGEFKDIQINTNEGTWMNVDMSPDGKYVVFDMLGDIYRIPAKGGDAELLIGGIAWHMQPVYSPDGKYIAYTSDADGGDNIWIMDADGSNPRAVTNETFRLLNSPAWSPDSEFLVARKHFTARRSLGAGEVWMYHRSGGSGVMLTERPNDQKDLGEPAFSPDGRYIYFSQDDTPGKTFHYSKDSLEGIYEIKRFDRETGEIDVILAGAGGAIRPTPSPDGKYLAYVKREDFNSVLYLYDLESGEKRRLYTQLDRDMQETWAIHGVYPTMDWTPDSKNLVFWADGKIMQLDIADRNAKVIPFSVSTTKKVQQALRFEQNLDQDRFKVKMLRMVQVAPDGSEVVYEALGKLYVRSLPDGTPKRLTEREGAWELYPTYSRDGSKLVYATWDDEAQGSLVVRDLKSGKERIINTGTGKFIEPVFSPDGNSLVYRKIRGGYITPDTYGLEPGIYHVGLQSGAKPSLISERGYQPQFGARSDRVYLMDSGAAQELFSVDTTTREQRTLYTSEHATEFRVAPDGSHLAFAERFKVFVTPFVERGSPIKISPTDKQFPVQQLSARAGENISWTADGSALYWSLGPELYHSSVAGMFDIKADDAAFEQVSDGLDISFEADANIHDQTVAFVGGQVITMEGEEVIEQGTVIVRGNKIIEVGAKADVTVPAGAVVIDTTGKTVMPGLFDGHAHGPQGDNEIIPEQNWKTYATLSFGVTSIHDPSNDTTEIFAASELQKAGLINAPRTFSTGTILYGANGPGYTSHVDSLDDAKFHLERLKKVGAFSVKSYNQPRRNQRQQVVQAGRELEMMVVPEGGSLLQHNLSMIADGHTTIEHSLPVAKIYDDIEQFWGQTEVAYTPTLGVAYGGIWGENYWYAETDVWKHPKLSKFVPQDALVASVRREKAPHDHYNHFNNADVAKKLTDEGVTVVAGAHGQREGLAQHWEIWMMAQGGMTPLEALATSTINPAREFGMDKHIGSLKAGKLADIIVIDGDPLADIRVTDRVTHTMVNGRLFDATTMDQLVPVAKPRKPFFWE